MQDWDKEESKVCVWTHFLLSGDKGISYVSLAETPSRQPTASSLIGKGEAIFFVGRSECKGVVHVYESRHVSIVMVHLLAERFFEPHK